jgi:hypothetical protein
MLKSYQTLAKKIMFWALARVSFSAAKIVSYNNKKKIHGLPSKLLQLFYFTKEPKIDPKSQKSAVTAGRRSDREKKGKVA